MTREHITLFDTTLRDGAQTPGVDFSRALLAGLDERLEGHPPEAGARAEIWVNTQRARRALLDLMNKGPSRLLPRVRVVTDLASDPLAPLSLHPAAHVFHYASTCFEGFKAYRWSDGKGRIFRLHDHVARMQRSAASLQSHSFEGHQSKQLSRITACPSPPTW